jgi:hypothetical protein
MNPGQGKSHTAMVIAMLKALDHPYEIVRDFAVIDSSKLVAVGEDNPENYRFLIMHLPSGSWHGFNNRSHAEAVAALQADSSRDLQLATLLQRNANPF